MRIVFKVGEFVEYRQVLIDITLICVSACCTVYNRYNLRTGDIVIALESAGRITVEPADLPFRVTVMSGFAAPLPFVTVIV